MRRYTLKILMDGEDVAFADVRRPLYSPEDDAEEADGWMMMDDDDGFSDDNTYDGWMV